jgi:hypothetical protein
MLVPEVDGTDFRLSRRSDGAEPVAAHSLRECRGAMERRRRLYAYLGFGRTDAPTICPRPTRLCSLRLQAAEATGCDWIGTDWILVIVNLFIVKPGFNAKRAVFMLC